MTVKAGDRISVESERVGQPPRQGVVEEVLGSDPPRYRVRWDDGRTSVIAPSAGAVRVEARRPATRRARAAERR